MKKYFRREKSNVNGLIRSTSGLSASSRSKCSEAIHNARRSFSVNKEPALTFGLGRKSKVGNNKQVDGKSRRAVAPKKTK